MEFRTKAEAEERITAIKREIRQRWVVSGYNPAAIAPVDQLEAEVGRIRALIASIPEEA